ncbi:MAG: hypothetical protein WDM88_08460 [Galbitalea sp.]
MLTLQALAQVRIFVNGDEHAALDREGRGARRDVRRRRPVSGASCAAR